MVFEDAHWIDPSSRELLDLIFDRVRGLDVLLVVTFRPEFQHALDRAAACVDVGAEPPRGRRRRSSGRAPRGNAGLSHEIVEEIVERADGVPLFVEELTKAVLESADATIASPRYWGRARCRTWRSLRHCTPR